MRFESKFELGDEVFYYDQDYSNKIVKAKIMFIEANAKFDVVTQKWIVYSIEFPQNDKTCTRSSIRENKLMTKQEAKAFYDSFFQEEKARLFGEEALIKMEDHWTEEIK